MGRFGTRVAQAAAALAVGVASVSAFVPAAHASDGCTATIVIINDKGQTESENKVPCTGGQQNGHAYLYDTHGQYLGQVYNEPPTPDPPLEPVPPPDPVRAPSGGGSHGTSHSSTSGSGSGHTTGHTKPSKPGTARSTSTANR